ncbi:DUF2330 domain-containing protein, partial [Streptomyces sp. SM14]|uniref:DUF2330 domain-containing protein n=1 Tax=Streptomyces sp. SM14 TaxID=1736045 RepID=UPI0021560663
MLAGLVALTQLTALSWPAHACGCGAMVTGDGQAITVTEETSLVTWDGETQEIVMRLSVTGDADAAAWVMPVPSRAEVELGEPRLFAELERLTAPEFRTRSYFWPREGDWPRVGSGDTAGAPGDGADGGVEVVGREQLGPFDVARLAAGDPRALEEWLRENGFALSERLGGELEHYVTAGWEYVAVRLVPGAGDEAADEAVDRKTDESAVLGGRLEPLHLSFATDEPVYPMRLSRLADNPQRLTLYVLADHRTELAGTIGGDPVEVTFAGRLDAERTAEGPLRPFLGQDSFLTVLEQDFPEPGRITDDHELVRAAADTEYREVYYRDRLLTWGGVPAWRVTVGSVAGLAVLA